MPREYGGHERSDVGDRADTDRQGRGDGVPIDRGAGRPRRRVLGRADDRELVEEGVVHYCVTNMPGAVARTSTFALNDATLPFVIAAGGPRGMRITVEHEIVRSRADRDNVGERHLARFVNEQMVDSRKLRVLIVRDSNAKAANLAADQFAKELGGPRVVAPFAGD